MYEHEGSGVFPGRRRTEDGSADVKVVTDRLSPSSELELPACMRRANMLGSDR